MQPRTSCTSLPTAPPCRTATANQFRLVIHTAYWLLLSLHGLVPKTSFWREAQFDTIRLCLIKVAARVTERVTRINRPPSPTRPVSPISPAALPNCRRKRRRDRMPQNKPLGAISKPRSPASPTPRKAALDLRHHSATESPS